MDEPAGRASVVIPCFRDDDGLAATLDGLRGQVDAAPFDVIVVNNDAERSIAPDATALDLSVIDEATPGSYAARNAGLAASESDLLAFIDAGCRPTARWLAEGLAGLASGADIVGGDVTVVAPDAAPPSLATRYELARGFPVAEYVERYDFAVTANLFTTRAVLDAAGPFDAGLKSGGDAEWCQRAVTGGAELVFAPLASVSHPARGTIRGLVAKARRVSGGLHDRAVRDGSVGRYVRRSLWRDLLPPVAPTLRLLRRRDEPVRVRVALASIEVLLNYVRVAERLKLMVGIGRSKRS